MINKIIGSFIFVSCLFAIFLSLSGVDAPLWFGEQFRSFIVTTNYDIENSWLGNVRIPDIPVIPNVGFLPWSNSISANVIVVLNNFFNGFATFINGLVTILNVVILILNTLLQLLSFVIILLRNIIILRDTIIA